jgi:ELWxxDGT repeat protein
VRALVRSVALIGALLCAPTLPAAQLLLDINSIPAAPSVTTLMWTADLPALTLFVFDDGIHGAELWATDGTPSGTRMVRDINPGPAPSGIREMTVVQGTAFFWADDGTNGVQLWKSDGTTAGTALVATTWPTTQPGQQPMVLPPPVAMGGVVYFAADDGNSGNELWRSDGTAAGTYLLKDIAAGAASSSPTQLTVAGSQLYFVADDGVHGQEVWTTDGTVAGTHLVQDISPGSTGSNPQGLLTVDGTLFFLAGSSPSSGTLWRAASDGSSATAVPGLPASSLAFGSIPTTGGVLFETADGEIYKAGVSGPAIALAADPCGPDVLLAGLVLPAVTLFSTQCDVYHPLWRTDGTPGGTAQFDAQSAIIMQEGAITANGKALFMGGQAIAPGVINQFTPINIWLTDGTLAGTQQISSFAESISTPTVVAVGNQVLFAAGASQDPAGQELWASDGTTAGTTLVKDINPGPGDSNPDQLTYARGRLLFMADDGVTGRLPWISDGSAAGTLRLLNTPVFRPTGNSGAANYFAFGSGALFTADNGVTGSELWFTDGTAANTYLIKDINPGSATSNPLWFVQLGSQVLFDADDGSSGRELWSTDGTTANTFRVADINPGAGSSDPIDSSAGAFVVNGVAYFGANDGTHGVQLWRSDGTAAGTYLFMQLTTPPANTNMLVMGSVGGHALFAANTQTSPTSQFLWASDGTVAGTAPLRTDVTLASPLDFAIFQGYLYFQGTDASGDAELWRSDGTAAGTTLVQKLNPSGSSSPHGFYANNAFLMFSACAGSAASSCGQFASSNPSGGVTQLGTVQINGPAVTDGTRLFFVDGTTLPLRMVVTDGTAAGTYYLQGNLPFSGDIGGYYVFDGMLVMTVNDARLGPSIWASDGTVAGTHLLADIDPSMNTDYPPAGYFALGTKLLVDSWYPNYGYEPWVMDAATPNAADISAATPFNTAASITVLANAGYLTSALDPGSVTIVTPPALGSATVNASGQIVYTPNSGVSGEDTLQYTVKNLLGNTSNVASLYVSVGAPPGPASGTAPSPPTPTPTPPPASSGGGGGGGALDLLVAALLASLLLARGLPKRGRLPAFTARLAGRGPFRL